MIFVCSFPYNLGNIGLEEKVSKLTVYPHPVFENLIIDFKFLNSGTYLPKTEGEKTILTKIVKN